MQELFFQLGVANTAASVLSSLGMSKKFQLQFHLRLTVKAVRQTHTQILALQKSSAHLVQSAVGTETGSPLRSDNTCKGKGRDVFSLVFWAPFWHEQIPPLERVWQLHNGPLLKM